MAIKDILKFWENLLIQNVKNVEFADKIVIRLNSHN